MLLLFLHGYIAKTIRVLGKRIVMIVMCITIYFSFSYLLD